MDCVLGSNTVQYDFLNFGRPTSAEKLWNCYNSGNETRKTDRFLVYISLSLIVYLGMSLSYNGGHYSDPI